MEESPGRETFVHLRGNIATRARAYNRTLRNALSFSLSRSLFSVRTGTVTQIAWRPEEDHLSPDPHHKENTMPSQRSARVITRPLCNRVTTLKGSRSSTDKKPRDYDRPSPRRAALCLALGHFDEFLSIFIADK
jgi:hypothetical protein